MILKELKWNLKWAVIAGVAWTLCLAGYAMNWSFDQTRTYENLLPFEAQAVTFVGFPAFGFLLGFLQIFFESRRDAWAFLVHRPLSRRDIFWSKVIAGLLLYFAAFLIPALVFLGWLLLPKELPIPFEWRVALPALSDFLSGMVCYFAGLLVGLRQARWYGSRLWPILVTFLVSLLLLILGTWPKDPITRILVPRLWFAIWFLIFVISIALPLAAYGAFRTGGTFSRQPRLCRRALALILTIAGAAFFAFCWLFLTVSVVGIMNMLQRRLESPRIYHDMVLRYPAKTRSSKLAVTKDGRVVTIVFEQTNPTRQSYNSSPDYAPITAILDESGKPMEEFKAYIGNRFLSTLSNSSLPTFQSETLYIEYLRPSSDRENGQPRSFGYRQQPFYLQHGAQEKDAHWFYYPKRRLFFGYLRTGEPPFVSYQSLGSCGRNGFQLPTAPHAIPFDPPIIEGVYYGAGQYYTQSEVYRIDFQTRETKRVLSLPQGESIAAIASPPKAPQSPDEIMMYYSMPSAPILKEREKDVYVLTNEKRLLFIHSDEGVLAEINLANVLAPMETVSVGCIPDKKLYFVQTDRRLLEFSKDGQILAQYKLPTAPVFAELRYVDIMYGNLVLGNTWQISMYCWKLATRPISIPPLLFLAWNVSMYLQRHDTPSPPIPFLGKAVLVRSWYEGGSCLVGALLALLFCNRRLRKYPFSRGEKITWRLLMFLIGPGALLALYALYDWPAKEPCPACGKMRVVNRERCEFCGAPFPPPAPTGKEIFETAG